MIVTITARPRNPCTRLHRGRPENNLRFPSPTSGPPREPGHREASRRAIKAVPGRISCGTSRPLSRLPIGRGFISSRPAGTLSTCIAFRLAAALGRARLYHIITPGGMAERTNAAVLKTVEHRKVLRGFESHSLRHTDIVQITYVSCKYSRDASVSMRFCRLDNAQYDE
jgi:hypothetical protein